MAIKETAEQKLLKIIEASQGQEAAPLKSTPSSGSEGLAQEIAAAVKGPGIPSFSNTFETLLGFFKPKSASGPALAFGPREINRILSVSVILVLCAFSANVFSGIHLLSRKVAFSVDTKTLPSEASFFPSVAAITDYLVNIKKRNIFQPYEKKEEEQVETTSLGSSRILGMIRKFKLVGISWLDSPESASAMIENVDSGATQFLKAGDKINDVTIKEIFADRVLLTYQGEELVLKL